LLGQVGVVVRGWRAGKGREKKKWSDKTA